MDKYINFRQNIFLVVNGKAVGRELTFENDIPPKIIQIHDTLYYRKGEITDISMENMELAFCYSKHKFLNINKIETMAVLENYKFQKKTFEKNYNEIFNTDPKSRQGIHRYNNF
ncbi:MAG: hypothetical protein [Bacteriophage sp.]|nr:MAG: hypothetical protein [Bacteriophage sp.]